MLVSRPATSQSGSHKQGGRRNEMLKLRSGGVVILGRIHDMKLLLCTYCKIHNHNESVLKSDDAVILTKLGCKYIRYELAIGAQ